MTTVVYLPYGALGIAIWVGGSQLLRRDVRPSLGVTWAGALVGLPLILGVTRADLVHLAFVGPACLAGVLSGLHYVSSSRPTRRLLTVLLCSLGLAAVGGLAAKTARLDPRLAGWEDHVLGLDQSQWLTTHARLDETIVDSTHWAGMSYLLLRRPASPFTFLPGEGEGGYFTAAQWRRLADAVAERRPRAMLLDAYRWGQILRARPDVADLYREDSPGRWLRRDAEEGHRPLVVPAGPRLVD